MNPGSYMHMTAKKHVIPPMRYPTVSLSVFYEIGVDFRLIYHFKDEDNYTFVEIDPAGAPSNITFLIRLWEVVDGSASLLWALTSPTIPSSPDNFYDFRVSVAEEQEGASEAELFYSYDGKSNWGDDTKTWNTLGTFIYVPTNMDDCEVGFGVFSENPDPYQVTLYTIDDFCVCGESPGKPLDLGQFTQLE